MTSKTHLFAKKRNRYYLMRHGESLANRNGLIVSSPANAVEDFGLTSKGAEQVMQSALNTRLDRGTIIVSSDFKRALETAQIVKSVLDCQHEIVIEQGLRERGFGDWELQDHANYAQIWQHDLTHPNTSTDNVETVENTLSRALGVIDSLEQHHESKNMLLVSHGDVLQILLAYHHNINPRFHRSVNSIGNADIRSLAKLDLNSKQPAA